MATLRNKRKLAAVSRETPEITRNSRMQNTLDRESTQDYISQVSEEIEGRITKKLSEEVSRIESRILGALSKLDEFLLNPQVRTCSVAVLRTSRNNNSENRETTGDRSSEDPCPQVRYSSHHSRQLNSSEAEDCPHTGVFFPPQFYVHKIVNLFIHAFMHPCLFQLWLFTWWREKRVSQFFAKFLWYVDMGKHYTSQSRSEFDWYNPHVYNY